MKQVDTSFGAPALAQPDSAAPELSIHSACARPRLWRFLAQGGAINCPTCGARVELSRTLQSVWAVIGIVLLIVGLLGSARLRSHVPISVTFALALLGELLIAARAPVLVVTAATKRFRTMVDLAIFGVLVTVLLVLFAMAKCGVSA